jgi:tripartite-type tricarboxylate transporter receptor subunit TctC
VGLIAVASPLVAQTYPTKAVRIVVPWPPGGSNEIVSRVVGQRLAEVFGQPFVIDLRPGAAGTLGADLVAKSPPDGYTLMVHSTTHIANAHLYPKLPYDTRKDFAAVALMAAQPGALVVHPSLPARTTREFIALAKSRPGAVSYSSSGSGSAVHLSMSLLAQMTGIDVLHVPYRGGVPQVTAVTSGETHAAMVAIATGLGQIRAGRLRALGVTSAKRSAALPDVPTLAESGAPGYEMSTWIAAFAPAGTPRSVIVRLNAEINATLARPDVSRVLSGQAAEPWVGTLEEFEARLAADYEKYGKLIRLTGAKVD